MIRTMRWYFGARTRFDAASRTPTSGTRHCALLRLSRPRASSRAIVLRLICPTCPKRSSRCWAQLRSAPSGRRARRTSACKASSIVLDKSNPRCSSPSTATGTTAKSYPCSTRSLQSSPGYRRSRLSSSFLICSGRPGHRTICPTCVAVSAGTIFSRRMPVARSTIRSFRSIIRRSCSIRLARPACRSASCMAQAERFSSISRSICCTAI
jgi:hypothetical protein